MQYETRTAKTADEAVNIIKGALGVLFGQIRSYRGEAVKGWNGAFVDHVMVEAENALAFLSTYNPHGQVYVPGVWRCAKCDFRLIQSNLNARDGTVMARDTPGDKCPNCHSPLWRVTERQERIEAMKLAETGFMRAGKAEDALQDLADAADAVGIRFFDTDTMEPEVEAMQKATIAAREVLEPTKRRASAPITHWMPLPAAPK